MDHLIWTMHQNQEFLVNPIQTKKGIPRGKKNTLHLGHNQILQNPSSSKLAHKKYASWWSISRTVNPLALENVG